MMMFRVPDQVQQQKRTTMISNAMIRSKSYYFLCCTFFVFFIISTSNAQDDAVDATTNPVTDFIGENPVISTEAPDTTTSTVTSTDSPVTTTDGTEAPDTTTTTTGGGPGTIISDGNDIAYTDCDPSVYYATLLGTSSDPTTWSRDGIIDLLTTTHRRILPNIANESDASQSEDIISALGDLFPGNEPSTVYDWFRNVNMPFEPSNTPESWRRGDLWPRKYGADLTTPAATDVHVKQPIDWTVNDELENLLFGMCGVVNDPSLCVVPANPECAPTTEQDNKIKAPPTEKRGDTARALFYNALRYEKELGLTLSDCPPFGTNGNYGYLSELLQWHQQDPVDELEMSRNNRACNRWQGNRNIFIDYPDLVSTLFGSPDTVSSGTYLYSACTVPTDAPTATPNDCSALRPGDIQIYLTNSNHKVSDPETEKETQIIFFPLDTISPAVEYFYVTDRAWNGTDFVTDEGTAKYQIPEEGIDAGLVFAYGVKLDTDNGTWTDVNETNPLMLSDISGDNILVYCLNADELPHFVGGLIYNEQAKWSDAGKTQYLFNESALPDQLVEIGNVALPLESNYRYIGNVTGTRANLVVMFSNGSNYEGQEQAWVIGSAAVTVVQYSVVLSTTLSIAISTIMLFMIL